MTYHEFSKGPWNLAWSDETGEGYDGDYDPSDPDDRLLLRADLFYEMQPVDDGSYCTAAPADTPADVLASMSALLLEHLPASLDDYSRKLMERWTWQTDPRAYPPAPASTPTPAPAPPRARNDGGLVKRHSVIVFSFFPGNAPTGGADVDGVGGHDWWPDDKDGREDAAKHVKRFLDSEGDSLGTSSFTLTRIVLPSGLNPRGDEAECERITEWLDYNTVTLRELPEQTEERLDEAEADPEATAARRQAARAALREALED